MCMGERLNKLEEKPLLMEYPSSWLALPYDALVLVGWPRGDRDGHTLLLSSSDDK